MHCSAAGCITTLPHAYFPFSKGRFVPTQTFVYFRSLQLVPPKEEPAHSRNVSQRSLDADAPGPSSRIQDASYKEPKQEAAEEDGLSPVITEFLGFPEGPPAAASGNERTVYGFSYSFAAMQPTGLDMYRCVREKTCSALMFVHPDTGEIRFEGDHSHDVNAVRFIMKMLLFLLLNA